MAITTSRIMQMININYMHSLNNSKKHTSEKTEKKSKKYEVDKSLFVLVMDVCGLCLYFRNLSKCTVVNEQLLASYLSALINFGKTILKNSTNLNLMAFDNQSILIKKYNLFYFIYGFQGNIVSSKQRFDLFVYRLMTIEDIWNEFLKVRTSGKMLSNQYINRINTLVDETIKKKISISIKKEGIITSSDLK
jgi:hypothetical protein